jgi:DNA-binding CsgD family transcriptional regulator
VAITAGELEPDDPPDPVATWQAVVDGRWSLVEHFDSDGRRCFVIRKHGPTEPVSPLLNERERQIVALASVGHSNKLIAYELGLSSSRVATQLTSAARKLGVASRKTLLHAFAVLGNRSNPPEQREQREQRNDNLPARMTRFAHGGHEFAVIKIDIAPKLPSSLTVAESEIATLVIEGLSNAAIAERRRTSVRTVANQLRSIYSKLGVESRRQLCSRFSLHIDLGTAAVAAAPTAQ